MRKRDGSKRKRSLSSEQSGKRKQSSSWSPVASCESSNSNFVSRIKGVRKATLRKEMGARAIAPGDLTTLLRECAANKLTLKKKSYKALGESLEDAYGVKFLHMIYMNEYASYKLYLRLTVGYPERFYLSPEGVLRAYDESDWENTTYSSEFSHFVPCMKNTKIVNLSLWNLNFSTQQGPATGVGSYVADNIFGHGVSCYCAPLDDPTISGKNINSSACSMPSSSSCHLQNSEHGSHLDLKRFEIRLKAHENLCKYASRMPQKLHKWIISEIDKNEGMSMPLSMATDLNIGKILGSKVPSQLSGELKQWEKFYCGAPQSEVEGRLEDVTCVPDTPLVPKIIHDRC